MSKTSNIGLNLTENESTMFSNWRKSIDGNGSGSGKSNMQLIDEAFGNGNALLNDLIALLIDILKAGVYTSDQTDNLNALKEIAFGSGAGNGSSSGVSQTGSRLKIVDGVAVSQNGSNLVIA